MRYADGKVYIGSMREDERSGRGTLIVDALKDQQKEKEGRKEESRAKGGAKGRGRGRGRGKGKGEKVAAAEVATDTNMESDEVERNSASSGLSTLYSGEWRADKRHGPGLLLRSDGSSCRQQWKDGTLVAEEEEEAGAGSEKGGPGAERAEEALQRYAQLLAEARVEMDGVESAFEDTRERLGRRQQGMRT